jgi:hypothetical protein
MIRSLVVLLLVAHACSSPETVVDATPAMECFLYRPLVVRMAWPPGDCRGADELTLQITPLADGWRIGASLPTADVSGYVDVESCAAGLILTTRTREIYAFDMRQQMGPLLPEFDGAGDFYDDFGDCRADFLVMGVIQ